MPIQASGGAAGAANVCLTAYGAAASASNNVNHTEPVGGRPGRWWVVYRIQAPRGRRGSTARR
jgi:hypothetical protein